MQRPRIQLRTILVFIAFLALGMVVAVQSIRLDRSLNQLERALIRERESRARGPAPKWRRPNSRERRPRRQPAWRGPTQTGFAPFMSNNG